MLMYFAGIRSSSNSRRAPKPTTCRPESRIGHTARPLEEVPARLARQAGRDQLLVAESAAAQMLQQRAAVPRSEADLEPLRRLAVEAALSRGTAEPSTASGLLSCSTKKSAASRSASAMPTAGARLRPWAGRRRYSAAECLPDRPAARPPRRSSGCRSCA